MDHRLNEATIKEVSDISTEILRLRTLISKGNSEHSNIIDELTFRDKKLLTPIVLEALREKVQKYELNLNSLIYGEQKSESPETSASEAHTSEDNNSFTEEQPINSVPQGSPGT